MTRNEYSLYEIINGAIDVVDLPEGESVATPMKSMGWSERTRHIHQQISVVAYGEEYEPGIEQAGDDIMQIHVPTELAILREEVIQKHTRLKEYFSKFDDKEILLHPVPNQEELEKERMNEIRLTDNQWDKSKQVMITNLLSDDIVLFFTLFSEFIELPTKHLVVQTFDEEREGSKAVAKLVDQIHQQEREMFLERTEIISPELRESLARNRTFRGEVVHKLGMVQFGREFETILERMDEAIVGVVMLSEKLNIGMAFLAPTVTPISEILRMGDSE